MEESSITGYSPVRFKYVVLQLLFGEPNEVQIKLRIVQKRKHKLDTSRKHTSQYKRQRSTTRRRGTAQQDSTYGKDAAEPEVMESMGEEYLVRLKVIKDAKEIAERTALQPDDDSGEWTAQRKGRLTAVTDCFVIWRGGKTSSSSCNIDKKVCIWSYKRYSGNEIWKAARTTS